MSAAATGAVLLHRHDADAPATLVARATAEEPVHRLEQALHGGTHASLCADVLSRSGGTPTRSSGP